MKTMRPKYLLWIASGVAFSAWYVLDPAAHRIGGVLANASQAKVHQIVLDGARAAGVRTALL